MPETKTLTQPFIKFFFDVAHELHECTDRLFARTPYTPEKWPEIWAYEVELLKPYIDDELYSILREDELLIDRQTLPTKFAEALQIFDQEFLALVPKMLVAIENVRHALPSESEAEVGNETVISRYFANVLISRPKQSPFADFDFGVGLTDKNGSPQKANKNGTDTQRLHYLSTELLLMISLLTKLPKVKVFLSLFPTKIERNLIDEWQTLRSVCLTYYYSLFRYCTCEALYDDLLVLFGCYEIFTKSSHLKRDSEKFIVFFVSIARKALSHRRFWEHVVECLKDDREELLLQFVIHHFLKPRKKGNVYLWNIFLRNLEASDLTTFTKIPRLQSQSVFAKHYDYPRTHQKGYCS